MSMSYVNLLSLNVFIFRLPTRYGIRVDPIQWFVVLIGKDEGTGLSALLLLICEIINSLYFFHMNKIN